MTTREGNDHKGGDDDSGWPTLKVTPTPVSHCSQGGGSSGNDTAVSNCSRGVSLPSPDDNDDMTGDSGSTRARLTHGSRPWVAGTGRHGYGYR